MATIEELEEKIEERRKARGKAEDEQRLVDLEARIDLEEEHGTVAAVRVAFRKGFPTCVYLTTPTSAQYKRYLDQVGRAGQQKNMKLQREAQELMARSCWVYPRTDEERAAMLEVFPGLVISIAIAATGLAEGKQEEEGKG